MKNAIKLTERTIIDEMCDKIFCESQEHDRSGKFLRKLWIQNAYEYNNASWSKLYDLVVNIINDDVPDEFVHFRDRYFRVSYLPDRYIIKGLDPEYFADVLQDGTSPDPGFTLRIQSHFFKLNKRAQMYVLISTLGLVYAPGNFEGWFAGIRAQRSKFWSQGELQPQYVNADKWTQKEMRISDQMMVSIMKSIDSYLAKIPCPMKEMQALRYLNYTRSCIFNKDGLFS